MPELPEVEAARRLVERECVGKVIKEFRALESGGGARDGLFDDLVFSGPLPTWHFGMTGAFSIRRPTGESAAASLYKRVRVCVDVWPPKFTKCEVVFEDGTALAFTDPRRLGRVKFVDDVHAEPPVSELGPDPVLAMMPLPEFSRALGTRSIPIKALLLDQSFLAGIGNWVADEVLFQAAVHPETPANALDEGEIAALHERIVHVLKYACDVNADNSKFPSTWLFHHRWGKAKGGAKTAEGHAIAFITVGGRTSAVVPAIQGTPRKTKAEGSTAARNARRAAHIAAVDAGESAIRGATAPDASPVLPDTLLPPDGAPAMPATSARKRARKTAGAESGSAAAEPDVNPEPKAPPSAEPEAGVPAPRRAGRSRAAAGMTTGTEAAAAAPAAAGTKRRR